MYQIGHELFVIGKVTRIEITADEITYHISNGMMVSMPVEDESDLQMY